MLLVGCPLDKARQIADDVCRTVADYRFVWQDRIFNIGVSIGLVELSRDSGSIEESLAAADSACYVAKRQGGHVTVYSARDEAFARQSGEIHWLQTLQAALKEQPLRAVLPADRRGVRRRRAGARRWKCCCACATMPASSCRRRNSCRRPSATGSWALIDRRVVQTTLDRARPRRASRCRRNRSVGDQHLGPDARRRPVPRVRGRVPRLHRRQSGAGVLRDRGERGDRQPRARAALHRRAARHGLPLRARRLRQRHGLVLQPEEPGGRLPEDRRLLHAQPRRATASTRPW